MVLVTAISTKVGMEWYAKQKESKSFLLGFLGKLAEFVPTKRKGHILSEVGDRAFAKAVVR